MRIAAVSKSERLTEVDGSEKVSVRVVRPHAVSELVSLRSRLLPHPQADVARSWIDIRVVHLGPTEIPELVRFLDGLGADVELDVGSTTLRPRPTILWLLPTILGGGIGSQRTGNPHAPSNSIRITSVTFIIFALTC